MRTEEQLKWDIDILANKLGEMRTNCISENRDPNKVEIARANEIVDEIEVLEKNLLLEQRTNGTLDRLREASEKPERTQIDTVKDEERDRRNHFASGGEFLQAVMRAGMHGGVVDPRLTNRAATGLSESIPSDGGFLVDGEMSNSILKNVWEESPILSRISKITLTGNKTSMKFNGFDETSRATGSRAGGITGYWKNAATTPSSSKPTFRQFTLSLNKLIGLCYATEEMLDDASALQQIITGGMQAEFKFLLANAIMNGSGAGQPLGIVNSGCVVSVAKETGQDANTVNYDNVNKMWSRLMASSRTNAIWVCNQDVEPQLHKMSLAIGTGGSAVFLPPSGVAGTPYSSLFGRPVVPIEQCPVLGDTGDIMLCDFSQYQAIDKGGMKSDVSIHIQFLTDESVFRMTYRFDGQPVLASAITPFTAGATTATDTLSHFVKIDAR